MLPRVSRRHYDRQQQKTEQNANKIRLHYTNVFELCRVHDVLPNIAENHEESLLKG